MFVSLDKLSFANADINDPMEGTVRFQSEMLLKCLLQTFQLPECLHRFLNRSCSQKIF